jgi:Cdc6-like AAA superfamily ATPase
MNQDTTQKDQAKLEKELSEVYSRNDPITEPKLFSGRRELLTHLQTYLSPGMTGVNFVFYGDRGVGKTSLVNILFSEYVVKRHTCSANDDFVSIFLSILSDLGEQFTDEERRVLEKTGLSLGAGTVSPIQTSVQEKTSSEHSQRPVASQSLDLNFVLKKLQNIQRELDVIFLDEFQNIKRLEIQTQIIEVVKGLADARMKPMIVIAVMCRTGTNLTSSKRLVSPNSKSQLLVSQLR